MTGTLYLGATPIGNMEDITYRAVRVMREADLIAAEDTRRTRKLLTHYDIHTPLVSYHEHNKAARGAKLIEKLTNGADIVLVSDAGLPGIADPGTDLVRLAQAANVRVSPLPGANAALSALICSGLSTEMFIFVGFLPVKTKKRRELLLRLAEAEETLIIYSAPHDLRATLTELAAMLGEERLTVLARELTKVHEEFLPATLSDHLTYLQDETPKGEYVIVMEGKKTEESAAPAAPEDIVALYDELIGKGADKSEAKRETAQRLGISGREVYQAVLAAKEG